MSLVIIKPTIDRPADFVLIALVWMKRLGLDLEKTDHKIIQREVFKIKRAYTLDVSNWVLSLEV